MAVYAVTGAAGGIGKAVTTGLQANGQAVIGVDRRPNDIRADLANEEQLASAIGEIHKRAPDGLDGVVACAGVGAHASDRTRIPLVNYFATVEVIEALMPALESRRGAAVMMSSNAATLMPYEEAYVQALLDGDRDGALGFCETLQGFELYGGGKLALARWMRRRSASAAQAGVRLNALAGGFTYTPMTAAAMQDPHIGPSVRELVGTIPLGRGAQPEEQANAALFLLSAKASHIAGSVLFVDGGHDAMFRPDRV